MRVARVRELAVLLAGATLALVPGGCRRTATVPPTHKVLLVSIDTLRADYLGTYNPLLDTSPNIDRLAQRSFVFDDAVAQSTSTLPSHTSVIYSLQAFVHRAYFGAPTRPLLESPVQALRDDGFATGAFVGGGQLREAFGFNRGFDVYEDITTTYVPGKPPGQDRLARLLDAATGFLREHRDDDAFLLVHNYVLHFPHYPPAEYLERYRARASELGVDTDAGADVYAGTDDWRAKGSAVQIPDAPPDEAWYLGTPYRISYAAAVRYVDDFIGGLVDAVDALGLADETLIVLMGDHGETLGERGNRGHGTFVPEVLRVPLIVHVPGLQGRRIAAPVELIDVMPTVYALLGRQPPYPFMGMDLSPALLGTGPGPSADRIRYSENETSGNKERWVAVLQRPWKLVFSPDDPEAVELYDTGADPWGARNLAEDQGRVVSRLVGAYDRLVRSGERLRELFPPAGTDLDDLDPETIEQLRALGYIH